MNAVKKTDRPASTPHTFTLTVEVDPFWVSYLTQERGIFGQQYTGYWLRGIEHDPELGWLCWEDDERHRRGFEPDRTAARGAWLAGEPLPKGWYRLDTAAALRAWEAGVRRWGIGWYERVDAIVEDVVVQLALLGEVRYG